MAYGQQDESGGWRVRYKRPDGTWASKSGFSSEKAAEDWGNDQEALIRRHMWIDPRDANVAFSTFAPEMLAALAPRLEPGTLAKYTTHLDTHLLPQWSAWPLIGIFNNYVEIEKWVSELHEDYAESTVSSVFATFSSMMNAAVRARYIPANPCSGIRVSSGSFESDRLVASPAQALRAGLRLCDTAGLTGFVLCLMDLYTGARWGELVGQQRHEYDRERRAIGIQRPLKEIGGRLLKGGRPLDPDEPNEGAAPTKVRKPTRRTKGTKKGRTKSPAGTRWVTLPPSIAVLYETLMASHDNPFVFCTLDGHPLRRSNFRQRCWRPAWDGMEPDDPRSDDHVPAVVLSFFSFHEGRHSHNTWLTEDGVPEVARRARLGQKMKGIARVYDHVTPTMTGQLLEALETRWTASVASLTEAERAQLMRWFPRLRETVRNGDETVTEDRIAISSPSAG